MCGRFGGLVGYILLSVALGGVSIVLFPRKFAVSIWLQIANIVVSPIIVGVAKVWVGDGERERSASNPSPQVWFGLALGRVFAVVRFTAAA